MEPLPADGPADPWFRPVWEDGDDDPPPLPRRPHARLLTPWPDGFMKVAADPLRTALHENRGLAAHSPSSVEETLYNDADWAVATRRRGGWQREKLNEAR